MRKIILGFMVLVAAGAATPALGRTIESNEQRRLRQASEAREKLVALQATCVDALNQGRLDDAIAGCTAVIDAKSVKDANLATAHLARGAAQERKGDCVAAMADFDIAQTIIPNDPQVYISQFVCAMKLKDEAKATASLDKAIELKPEDVDLLRNRCIVRVNTKKYAAAIPDCEKVVAARPDDATIWLALGQMYEADKKNDLAKNAYAKVMALKPDNQPAADGLKRLGGAK